MGIVLLLLVLALTFAIFRRLLREESSGSSSWPPAPGLPLTRRDFLGARTPKAPPSNDPNEVARRSGSWG